MIELELKFKELHSKVIPRLVELGAELLDKQENIDLFFQHPIRDFGKTDEALRIRKINNEIELTYKGPKFDNLSKSREEINIKIDDKENIELLFKKLGFKESGRITKTRTLYKYKDITICLDYLKELGEFVEIEKIVYEKDYAIKLTELQNFAKKLNLNTHILKSYFELINDKINEKL